MPGPLTRPRVLLRARSALRSVLPGALLMTSLGLMPALSANAAAEADEVTLTLPEGFSAIVFHPGVGKGARHLAIRNNGDVLVSRQDGVLLALRDEDRDGSAERTFERALAITSGLQLHQDYVYFSDNVSVSRLRLDDGLLPGDDTQTIVSGFLEQGPHATKDFAINPAGELFVNVGAPSNACQETDRKAGSPGQNPCPELERQAGIWLFPADQQAQTQADGERYLTGTRNIVALEWNEATAALYFVMHGRDQLSFLWPEYFSDAESAELPAEEFHRALPGADFGWPYSFVDPASGIRLQAPEYGGDGKTPAPAGVYQSPLHAYPAHWAPNDLIFYSGSNFPARYQGGAFIAWRGSWNRSPAPQDGYRITFQPMADGIPSGDPEDFMLGFAGPGPITRSSDARYRPGGLALDTAGRLYVSETETGRIWRISYGTQQ